MIFQRLPRLSLAAIQHQGQIQGRQRTRRILRAPVADNTVEEVIGNTAEKSASASILMMSLGFRHAKHARSDLGGAMQTTASEKENASGPQKMAAPQHHGREAALTPTSQSPRHMQNPLREFLQSLVAKS